MFRWQDDLLISGANLYLDSRKPRPFCFISHAHADHLAEHEIAIATRPTLALAESRVGVKQTIPLEYDQPYQVNANTELTLFPAGHVLGSSMLLARSDDASFLYTGDFKLRESLTVESARVPRADVLLMESTYGQPFFRFPPWRETADELVDKCRQALGAGRQAIVMGYSLGKAQEITRILTDAGLNVTAHGAVHKLSDQYKAFGIPLGNYRKYDANDFHGLKAIDLAERGVLVAPPQVARSAFVNRFKDPLTIMMTGWAVLKNATYRYGVNHCLPLSDHADFDELLEMVDRVQPKKVYTHHGFPEFAEILRRRGIDAVLAKPDEQMSLFD